MGTDSINSGIPELYGAIAYSSVSEAIEAIQEFGQNCILLKRDFESAFRHIPVSPLDTPLLGFQWQKTYYSEQFLPFGLRTAPYLFNLFAEVFHWILKHELRQQSLPVHIVHYLDDFLLIAPPHEDLKKYCSMFTSLCNEVGLSIKTSKNEEGRVTSFAGVELDTENMVIRLPAKKLQKAQSLVQDALAKKSLSLLQLQKLTGYLNFVATVTPLGRTFLRRLYNMELYFPRGSRHQKRRLSCEAQKDLAWWDMVLKQAPHRSIKLRIRETISTWTDVASTKGLGAFFTSEREPTPQPDSAFCLVLPSHFARRREHINTQEMRAVEQALLYWGQKWKGKQVTVHTDNRTVAYGLAHGTTRGASMEVLRWCLLLATEYDLDLEAEWISTNDNALADALSRFDFVKITDLAPQLTQGACNLQRHGWQTYSNRDSQLSRHTISGEAWHLPQDATMTPPELALPSFAPFPTTDTTTEDASQPKSLG